MLRTRQAILLAFLYAFLHPAGLSWAGGESCVQALRDLERSIAHRLKGHTSPISHPASVTAEQIERADAVARQLMDDRGVRYEPVAETERRGAPLRTGLAIYEQSSGIRVTGSTSLGRGRLYRIRSMQPAGEGTLPDLWLHHPRTQALLDRLRAIGAEVYADPSLWLTGAGGIYVTAQHYIALRPGEPFHILVHEAQHAEFAHYDIAGFVEKAAQRLRDGLALEPLLAEAPHRGYGEDRLRRVLELVKQGLPSNAINESMSVEAQLAELRARGYHRWDSLYRHTRDYAAKHLLNDLVAVALQRELTPVERKRFLETLLHFRIPGWETFRGTDLPDLVRKYRREVAPWGFWGPRLAAGLGAAATIVGMVYHEALGHALVLLSSGEWLELTLPR